MQVSAEIIPLTSFNSFQRAVTLKRNVALGLINVFYMKNQALQAVTRPQFKFRVLMVHLTSAYRLMPVISQCLLYIFYILPCLYNTSPG